MLRVTLPRVTIRHLLVIALLIVAALPAAAQFGKNKITYQNFDWHVYRSPHFDIHYYPAVEPFLEEVVSYAESAYLSLSKDLDHELTVRVPLVIYQTHGEFQQTNITLAELPDGVGAFAEPIQYRMVLPIDQPPDKLYKLIAHELTHIFEYSMFYDGYLGRALRSRPPTWIMEGLASYMADDEDSLDQMAIRDAVVNNILPPIQALNVVTFLTYRYGNAIFDYIEQEHGPEGLRNFLFEFKKVLLTGNLSRAIKESFGYDIDEFNRRFNRYLRKKYFPVLLEKKSPDEYGTEVGVKQRGAFTFSPTISPSGELIAALSTPGMELDLVVLSAEDGKLVKNLTKGWTNKYQNLATEAFAGKTDVAWSPVEDRVAVFARKDNGWPLLIFNAVNGKLIKLIKFDDVLGNASPAYSPDGRRIAFEGNRDGTVDIFEIDLATEEIRNLTQDAFFDANPSYAPDGKTLLYNRRIGESWKIFSVDVSDPARKTQITFGKVSDIQPSYSRNGNSIYFSSDRGPYDVFNIHELDLQTGNILQYTDVVGGCFAPKEMAERDGERYLVFQSFFEGTFRLYRMPLREPELEVAAADRLELSQEDEVEPFEPALQLSVDEDDKSKYKLKWDIEAPYIAVGVTDDGTFLANGSITFTDLLGNHRIFIGGNSVSDFATFTGTYMNLKRRFNWGATVYDFRDFFYVRDPSNNEIQRKVENKATGGNFFIEYPISRYYRVSTSVGYLDSTNVQSAAGGGFSRNSDDWLMFNVSLIGDTTRYQGFGPFQGKRFNVGVRYGNQLSGDSAGDLLEYQIDYRGYLQFTRRSTLAWRAAATLSKGDAEIIYGFGGLNQLRGYEYRDFNGSTVAWTNLEFRFPLADELRFPILRLVQIRGFLFLDVGFTELTQGRFYDPVLGGVRVDNLGRAIKAKFWDSENDQLQDGRASYGVGFHFNFIGGLQFNWAFSKRFDHTQYLPDPTQPLSPLVKTTADGGSTRTEFYIAFDF